MTYIFDSDPMIRTTMYSILQQQQQKQQIPQKPATYTRQQRQLAGMDSMQHNTTDWRHLLMQQQQNANFNTMRPNFQPQGNVILIHCKLK